MGKSLKTTQKNIKEVKAKLKHSSVQKLSLEQLLVYLSYRLIELIDNEAVLDCNELLYRLCEVGPANLRFDPLTVEALLESEVSRDLFKASFIEREDSWFYLKKDYQKDVLSRVKHKIVEEIKENIASSDCLKLIKKKVSSVVKESGYGVISCSINEKRKFLEFILISETLQGRILLRFYNDNEWIYPFSWQVWEVFQAAGKQKCIPVLVASRIHGSCFPLFKAIGVLARSTYGIFSEKNHEKIVDKVLDSNEKSLLLYRKVAPGKFYCLSQAETKDLEGVKQLLLTVVPAYFSSSKKRFDQTVKKINPILNAPLQYLLDPQSSRLGVKEKVARIKGILTLKLGHLNALQDVVKRHEALIKELN